MTRLAVPPIQVLFVLQPDSLLLDWTGPAEALRIVNQCLQGQGREARFALQFIGTQPEAPTSVGCRVCGLQPLPSPLLASPATPTWVVLVGQPGPTMDVNTAPTRALLHWLRGLRLVPQQLELLTICAGTLLAAQAGLLQGRRVTTGLDLMLHRIASLCGEVIAAQVAQTMVVALRRGPQDPELSPFLSYRNHLHPALHRVQDAVSSQPAQNWRLPSMADIAHTSPRHLTRLFADYAGIAPLQYLRRIRLSVAQAALQSGRNVTQAAEIAGFSSDTQLRRAWHQFEEAGSPSKMHLL